MNWRESFAKLTEGLAKLAESRAKDYKELLLHLDAGRIVKDSDGDRVLRDAGKSQSDLQADLQLLELRRGWAAQESSRDRWQRQIEDADRQRAANFEWCNSEVARIRREYSEKQTVINELATEANRQLDLCNTARNRLQETHPQYRAMLEIHKQRGEVMRTIEGPLAAQLRLAEAAVDLAKNKIRSLTAPNDPFGMTARWSGTPEEFEKELKTAEAVLRNVKAAIAAEQSKVDELEPQVSELEDLVCVP